MSFWRKLNKLAFNISLVVFSLAVIGVAIWGFTWEWWLGLAILGGGIIVIPILFSAWGILLEFLDNVAAIRRQVCNGQPVVMNDATTLHASDKWICVSCGKKNDSDAGFCYNCGKPKG